MSALQGLRIVIAGGGVVGWTTALRLSDAGAAVTLADPDPDGPNASAIAAGMLAPAFEAVFDADADFDLLRRARDLWPTLAARVGLAVAANGALAIGGPAELDAWAARLSGLGVAWSRLEAAADRSPEVRQGLGGILTDADWRLDPGEGLAALRRASRSAGVVMESAAVEDLGPGGVQLSDGRRIAADRLVVATGASRSLVATAPELEHVLPIKGHILTAPGLLLSGPVVRFAGGYVCPGRAGAVIGATMEAGRADAIVDPSVARRLQALAAEVLPVVGGAPVVARAGVRAGTPDDLPMVGPSVRPGVWLAVGLRRNGWLLAPLVAEMIASGLAGSAGGAAAFAPGRFRG